MTPSGYYRFPTINGDIVVFTSDDDLWAVPAAGGVARRLTSSLSEASRPFLSPDGAFIAFTAREEGHNELYVMPAGGGEATRLTYFGANTRPVGWSADSGSILFATNHGQPFMRIERIYRIAPEGGNIAEEPVGPASAISYSAGGGCVIGRNTADPARWKRYRGGTAGDLWVDAAGSGQFRRLLTVRGNLAAPMWVGDRIYFLSDHEGYGNIYSCTPDGSDLQRHTDHDDFYARNPSSDGRRIVYHAGADLFILDPAADTGSRIEIEFSSPRAQRSRKFVQSAESLQDYALHPEGHSLVLTLRGKPVTMGAFSGPVVQHGELQGVRYRLARYLNDGSRLVAISDEGGEEAVVVLDEHGGTIDRLDHFDVGRAVELVVSPTDDRIALSNQRNETIVVDLARREMKIIDKSATLHSPALAWSPDGRWLAFNRKDDPETGYLMIADAASGEKHQVTSPILEDADPAFDPEGKYLYFLSTREFNPVYDNLHFDLGFPRGVRPYLVTLKSDTENPFLQKPKAPADAKEELGAIVEEVKKDDSKNGQEKPPKPVEIDFDGIQRRILPFPVPESRYSQIMGAKGKVFFVDMPIMGTLDIPGMAAQDRANGTLHVFEFDQNKAQHVVDAVSEFGLSRDGSSLVYRSAKRLRVLSTRGRIEPKGGDEPGRESGWVDLGRARVPIVPREEWRQMFREAWRLQREFFWTEGMLGLDWDGVHARYAPLVDRLATRSELSDLLWEMQGELGTSHAYESGGDYRRAPMYRQGFLGADFTLDESSGEWIVSHIVRGDVWSQRFGSPLEKPGVNLAEGDAIISINGRRLSRERHPYEQLVNTAETEIQLEFRPKGQDATRSVTVVTLGTETYARYREWVERNRARVHAATNGRCGYVHVPDMGPFGYSEFHRGFLTEVGRGSLVVDVRYNGGGHVSQLLLEKLARRVLGYDLARYSVPSPYPSYALSGGVVAITNENAGSDGDIFSHGFKMMKLGPLVGKRTWGGVVGIWPRNPLVDGSITTQPEFSFWFSDVKWGVENYGTDPDIDIDITPQDHVAGRDPQLERAIEEVMKLIESTPAMPEFAERPLLRPAALPVRPDKVAT